MKRTIPSDGKKPGAARRRAAPILLHGRQLAEQANGELELDTLYQGDCRAILPGLPNECVNLIVTSPPYADRRKSSYGGVHPDKYVEWFLPIAAELKRVLKPVRPLLLAPYHSFLPLAFTVYYSSYDDTSN